MNHRPDDTHLQEAFDATRAAASQLPTPDQHARARRQFLSEAFGAGVSPDRVVRLNDQGSAPPFLHLESGEQEMNRKSLRSTRLIAAVLLGVLLAGGFWASPGLRALAQEIIEFFITTEDEQPSSVFVGEEPPAQTSEPYVDPYTQTIEAVAAQVEAFEVRLPTFIPRSLTFKGATYRPYPQGIEMIYECRGTPFSFMISQYLASEDETQLEIGESAVIEEVTIHDTSGQYVKGWWITHVDYASVEAAREAALESGEGPVEVPATLVWSNELEFHRLSWTEDGINFSVATNSGIMSNDVDHASVCRIDRDVLAEIANGLLPASQINTN